MKWEYKTLDLGTGGFLGSKVDDSKLEGVIAIFKRPKQ
jgi:hypothetical protein